MRTFKFNIKGHDYEVEIKDFRDNIAEVEVNGTVYQVEVKRESRASKTPVIMRPEPPVHRSAHKFKKKIGTHQQITAPLPGTIMQIFVKEGEEIRKGQKLLMYEAMKMENTLYAEKDATIAKIKVSVGDNVLQGDLLIETA